MYGMQDFFQVVTGLLIPTSPCLYGDVFNFLAKEGFGTNNIYFYYAGKSK